MSLHIEDYAIIGDNETAALVGRDASIDWLCLPRFDSGACFAALLGARENGRWKIAPASPHARSHRRYRDDTLVLETEFVTPTGTAKVIDFMPVRDNVPNVVRIVEGISGHVDMQMDLVIRFDYGSIVPWVRAIDGALQAIAGPDGLVLSTKVPTHGKDLTTAAEFTVHAGDKVPFVLTYFRSHEGAPPKLDPMARLAETESFWHDWAGRCTYHGEFRSEVVRSLITLKALTYAPTGGIVAAVTTSLPERIGGSRNWDYRYCWLRDATFTLYALLMTGYEEEAVAWRNWLLRAVAGDPAKLQILYGAAGERRLEELEISWLAGYEGSRPVRVGNAAVTQKQLDVYGEVMDAMHLTRRVGIAPDAPSWALQRALLGFVERAWSQPDNGIWEVRGKRRHFTHSKVMAWVAIDRAIRGVEEFGLSGPVDRWRELRKTIHDEVCEHGFDRARNTFTQSYGSPHLDASLLMIPQVGFLPPDDPRVLGTIAAIERDLVAEDGLVRRYQTDRTGEIDGVGGEEGAFLACSFWLADDYALVGREAEARRLYTKLLAIRNDVGLLAEEYDSAHGRLVGNFPQAFSHVGLINTARNIGDRGPARHRLKLHGTGNNGAAAEPEAARRPRSRHAK